MSFPLLVITPGKVERDISDLHQTPPTALRTPRTVWCDCIWHLWYPSAEKQASHEKSIHLVKKLLMIGSYVPV